MKQWCSTIKQVLLLNVFIFLVTANSYYTQNNVSWKHKIFTVLLSSTWAGILLPVTKCSQKPANTKCDLKRDHSIWRCYVNWSSPSNISHKVHNTNNTKVIFYIKSHSTDNDNVTRYDSLRRTSVCTDVCAYIYL